jgi:succinoglycan biosynthesis protein ExoV
MLIQRFKPPGSQNFGDALNDYLWPKLLNPKFTEIPGYFYGIGTSLGERMPTDGQITVFGAGIGYAGVPKALFDWHVYFVRGPMTAAAMRAPYITDPGLLVHRFHRPTEPREPRVPCAFMPRWDNMSTELVDRCAEARIGVIDPADPVEKVIEHIRGTRLLLTEALHGAVVADTLRVPWVSIYADRGHEFKWKDWCGSMDMIWNPIDAMEYTLAWARDNAVPQLSALSVLKARIAAMDETLAKFNADIEGYIG